MSLVLGVSLAGGWMWTGAAQQQEEIVGAAQAALAIDGMTCSGCAVAVKIAARSVDGVTDVVVSVEAGVMAALGGPPLSAGAGRPQGSVAGQEAGDAQDLIGGGKATLVHPGDGGSPHMKVDWVVAGANISIIYGRPYLKGRVVGESVEPRRGRVWRLGADEATTLITDTDLRIGDTPVPAGAYTLWALDTGDTWQLIVNRETGQFGTSYDASRDLARVPMRVSDVLTPAEQLTLWVTDGEFKIEWGTKVATVGLQVKKR